MLDRDFAKFALLLDDAFSLNPSWKPLAPNGKALFFKALEQYPVETVSRAMTAHIRDPQRGKFQPTPADLVAQIDAVAGHDCRPGADEAWARSLTALDESETVVWSQEMRNAFAVCRPVLQAGDKIGARMAFKDAYGRMAAEAVRRGISVKWEVSLGSDQNRRIEAINRATVEGLLSAAQAQGLLSAPVKTEVPDAAEATRQRAHAACLKAEVAKLIPAGEKADRRRVSEIEALRQRTARRKREIDEKVAQYAAAHPQM